MREGIPGMDNQESALAMMIGFIIVIIVGSGSNTMFYFCLTGVLIYDKSTWFDSQPNIVHDDGDGTVNVRSLRACLNWQTQQKQPVFHKEFPSVDHMSLLKDAGVIQYLKQVLVGS